MTSRPKNKLGLRCLIYCMNSEIYLWFVTIKYCNSLKNIITYRKATYLLHLCFHTEEWTQLYTESTWGRSWPQQVLLGVLDYRRFHNNKTNPAAGLHSCNLQDHGMKGHAYQKHLLQGILSLFQCTLRIKVVASFLLPTFLHKTEFWILFFLEISNPSTENGSKTKCYLFFVDGETNKV